MNSASMLEQKSRLEDADFFLWGEANAGSCSSRPHLLHLRIHLTISLMLTFCFYMYLNM